jgi:hypothetical protein
MSYSVKQYPNLAALDKKVSRLLASKDAKSWTVQQTEYEISKIHPVYWMENYGYIRAGELSGGSDGVGIVQFKLNPNQLKIADKICAHLVPDPWTRVQILVLKHRKVGISTLIAGFDYWFARFVSNIGVFVIADLSSHTSNITSMIELFHERDLCGAGSPIESHWPPKRVPMPKAKSGIKLSNGSVVEQDSGENPNPGTSGTINVCHESENSKWREGAQRTAETSLLNSIPRTGFAFICKESTAFGLNKFADDCREAEKGDGKWEFIFISWKDSPDCEESLGTGEELEYTLDEKKLLETYDLRPGHIKFRRKQIDMLGSESAFRQDFPLNSSEPFLTTGTNYFNVEAVQDRMETIKFYRDFKKLGMDAVKKMYPKHIQSIVNHPRGAREALVALEQDNVMPIRGFLNATRDSISFAQDDTAKMSEGALEIYRSPQPGRKYLVVVDVAEGIKSTEYTSDNSIVEVFDPYRLEQVAEWGGLFDEEMAASYAVMIAVYYNKALLAPEMNNKCGGLLRANIEKAGYTHIYTRSKIANQQIKREYGWQTTVGNKKDVCGQLRQDFKNGKCLVHSIDLLNEMMHFIDSRGRLIALPGHTDDRVMAASIATKIVAETPVFHEPLNKKRVAHEMQVMEEYRGAKPSASPTRYNPLSKDEALRRYR